MSTVDVSENDVPCSGTRLACHSHESGQEQRLPSPAIRLGPDDQGNRHHDDLRRTRSAFQSVIPVSTGLARGIERLLPELSGRIQAKAVRVPTVNVSCLDITLQTARDTDAQTINKVLREAAESGPLQGLLAYTELPHASCDFNHDPHSAIVDGSLTRASGPRLVNLLAWFDNEWGFANRMLDVTDHYLRVAHRP